ncbi:response regulator [Methylomonas sp. AM2-LC]|uniref:response regulator n=1 Tax=Methylomonas sp. AM2-LC TaxID=3153301 RepID=UPI003264B854
MNPITHVLLVEDQEIIATVIADLLSLQGFQVSVYADGLLAWEHLQNTAINYDLILLDINIPSLDGMQLLVRIKNDSRLANIPVIFETGIEDKESIREGLQKGAYYFLTKPIQPDLLLAVVNAAIQQKIEFSAMVAKVKRAERPLALLQNGIFHFRELDEARLLANYLAIACPDAERSVIGLQELLINAVEHGNLGITYQEKSRLLLSNRWQQEVAGRLNMPQYSQRFVEVQFERQAQAIRFMITDQGQGFNWHEYLDFSTERAFDLHGRGIAMAKLMSFDQLQYQGNGNTVIATVHI